MSKMEVDKKTIDEIHTIFNILIQLEKTMEDDRVRGIELYDIAKKNYEDIKAKTELDELNSEDASIEEQLNNAIQQMTMAYKALTDTSNKIPKVMDVLSKLQVAKYKGDILLKISGHMEKEINLDNPDDKLELIRKKRALMKAADNLDKTD